MDAAILLRVQSGAITESDFAELARELLNPAFRAKCPAIGTLVVLPEAQRWVLCVAVARYLFANNDPQEPPTEAPLVAQARAPFMKDLRPLTLYRWEDHISLLRDTRNKAISARLSPYMCSIILAIEDLTRSQGYLVRRDL